MLCTAGPCPPEGGTPRDSRWPGSLWPSAGAASYTLGPCLLLRETRGSHMLFAVVSISLCEPSGRSGWLMLFTF